MQHQLALCRRGRRCCSSDQNMMCMADERIAYRKTLGHSCWVSSGAPLSLLDTECCPCQHFESKHCRGVVLAVPLSQSTGTALSWWRGIGMPACTDASKRMGAPFSFLSGKAICALHLARCIHGHQCGLSVISNCRQDLGQGQSTLHGKARSMTLSSLRAGFGSPAPSRRSVYQT